MPHFAIKMKDGSVQIMQTVGDATPEDCLSKWHPDLQANIVGHEPIEHADIPKDRSQRDAWTVHDGKIVIGEVSKSVAVKGR